MSALDLVSGFARWKDRARSRPGRRKIRKSVLDVKRRSLEEPEIFDQRLSGRLGHDERAARPFGQRGTSRRDGSSRSSAGEGIHPSTGQQVPPRASLSDVTWSGIVRDEDGSETPPGRRLRGPGLAPNPGPGAESRGGQEGKARRRPTTLHPPVRRRPSVAG